MRTQRNIEWATKPSKILWTIPLLIAVCLISVPAHAKYGGGSGTAQDPYQITTVTNLILLGESPEDYDKHFILTADIDLDPNLPGRKVFDKAVIAPDTNDVTSRFDGTAFTGAFDGNGMTISGLTIRSNNYVGLFGRVELGADIRDLGVIDVNVIAGPSSFSTSGVPNDRVGAIVGYNRGNITSCYAIGSVGGDDDLSYVGGLVGHNYQGSLTACYATVSIRGYASAVGGLVGRNDQGSLTACYATGMVSATIGQIGGLVGFNSQGGSLTGCFWDIETSNQRHSAGGKGLTTSQMKSLSIYQNAGWAGKGWIIDDGRNYPHLAWENTNGVPIPNPEPVPLLGSGTIEDPYQIWNAPDFALLSWYSHILDKHIVLMADIDLHGTTIYPIGDLGPFTGMFDGNDHIIRNADLNMPDRGYVGLFAYLGENGQIRNLGAEDLTITGRSYIGGLVAYNYLGSLITCHATGLVEGTGSNVGGLVGYNDSGSIDTCYTNADVSGNLSHVGGMVGGDRYGRFTSCYATGSVEAMGVLGWYVGGLVGCAYHSSIDACYTTGAVSGDRFVGGLVGENGAPYAERKESSVTACYATGSVTGNDHVGGLVGSNFGGGTWNRNAIITDCYSTGIVSGNEDTGGLVGSNSGSIESSFWDLETSGQVTSAGGTGKTTAQMQTASTFLDAGWDFIDENENGTDDIWWIDEGRDYPRLWWELIAEN